MITKIPDPFAREAKAPADLLSNPNNRQIFELVAAGVARQVPPTTAQIVRALGKTASSVHYQLEMLERAGLIEQFGERNAAKTVLLGAAGRVLADVDARAPQRAQTVVPPADFAFPAPAHFARCGAPQWADGELQRALLLQLFPQWRDGDRLIFPIGDSMIAPGDEPNSIYEGDWVHARDGMAPANGERVYVEYETGYGEHECMIKLFHLNEWTGVVTLQAANPDYPDVIRHGSEVTAHAVVLGVRRLVGGRK